MTRKRRYAILLPMTDAIDIELPAPAHHTAAATPTPPPAIPPIGPPIAAPQPLLAIDRTPALAVLVWRRMRREPSLMFTVAYVFVSFIGLWANYWFYRGFQLPILEYMQATDYLVAGLRDPMYGLILVATVLLVSLVSWPDAWRRNHPERVLALRRRWWGRALFPNNPMYRWTGIGMSPETGITLMAFAFTVWGASIHVQNKAADIRDHGGGQPVQVTLAGKATAQSGHARLLGTSSGFVFLWWPGEQRAEAVPIEGIGRLQTVVTGPPRAAAPGKAPQVRPAPASANAESRP